MKELRFLSQFFCGYCLNTCLWACKRISLDGIYFMVILTLKNQKYSSEVQLEYIQKKVKITKMSHEFCSNHLKSHLNALQIINLVW